MYIFPHEARPKLLRHPRATVGDRRRENGCCGANPMKTTRNSPRARKERAVAKRFLRLHRLTERELIALPYDRLTPMPEAYREWKKLARRLFLFRCEAP